MPNLESVNTHDMPSSIPSSSFTVRPPWCPQARIAGAVLLRLSTPVQEDDGRVWSHSEALNLDLWWTEGDLRFWDPAVGRWLLSHEEERDRAEEERTARITAESRVAELEAELRRLRS